MQVEPIVDSVRQRGDAAVKELTEKFDGVRLDFVCCPIEVRHCRLPFFCPLHSCIGNKDCLAAFDWMFAYFHTSCEATAAP